MNVIKRRKHIRLSEQVVVRLTAEHMHHIDRMMAEAGQTERAGFVRSLIIAVIEDDARAHSEALPTHAGGNA